VLASSNLIPLNAKFGVTTTRKPLIHAATRSLRTVATVKERGTARVEKYFSVLIAIKLFIVMEENNMLR